ncbi:MAG: nucleoside triphosphate pyrophosphatase [Anaeroplasma sp.]
MKNIILKSSSPRRKELLTKMGYDFTIKVFEVDEKMDKRLSPYENVMILGLKKAQEKANEDYGSILIGCDTIVVYNEKIYGKPKDKNDAFNMLKELNGHVHEVMSGVGVIYKDRIFNFVDISRVYFRNLSDEDILNYVNTNECMGKAGAYAIQGIGRGLIDHYEGSLDNIIGLPTEKLAIVLGEINEMED